MGLKRCIKPVCLPHSISLVSRCWPRAGGRVDDPTSGTKEMHQAAVKVCLPVFHLFGRVCLYFISLVPLLCKRQRVGP